MRFKGLFASRRVRVLATVGTVVMVGGVSAGAGLLIYQSQTGNAQPATEEQEADVNALQRVFVGGKTFEHYGFLADVKVAEIPTTDYADIPTYAKTGTKWFVADSAKIADLFFSNALKHATHWSEYDDYTAGPNDYRVVKKVVRKTDRQIQVVWGITKDGLTFFYDAGKISL